MAPPSQVMSLFIVEEVIGTEYFRRDVLSDTLVVVCLLELLSVTIRHTLWNHTS